MVNAKTPDGKPLVSGKRVTSFTNDEEKAVGLENVVPLSIEDEFKKHGATFERGDNWASYAVVDGKPKMAKETDVAAAALRDAGSAGHR